MSGVYHQPDVIEPPAFEHADNARKAIWHLGTMLTLIVFPAANHKWRTGDADTTDDGRHDRGPETQIQVRAVMQPNMAKRGRGLREPDAGMAEAETNYIVHLDSHDPVNIEAARANASVFPDGIRLFDFDDYGLEAGVNFPMAVLFRGQRFKIKQPVAFFSGGASDTEGALYRAECQIWTDRYQERNAVETSNSPVWGPT